MEIRRKKDYFENFYRMGENSTDTVSNGVAIVTKSNIHPFILDKPCKLTTFSNRQSEGRRGTGPREESKTARSCRAD